MWQLVLLIIASSKCTALSMKASITREMLVDFIQISDTPFVTTHFCWPSGDVVTLYNGLIKKNIRVSDSISRLKYVERMTVNKMMFVADMSCKDIHVYLQNANVNGYFEKPFKWILLESKHKDALPMELNNLMILPNSEVVIARRSGDDFILDLIYRISMKKNFIIENIALWNDSTRLIRNPNTLDAPLARRTNLDRINLTCSSVISVNDTIEHIEDMECHHYQCIDFFRNIEIDTLTKSSYAMVSTVLDFVNANKVTRFADTWGYNRNGSYSGMVGDLMRQDADIGATPMFITEDRLAIVDYIGRPIETSLYFVFQRPNLSFENNIFLLSFRYNVWLSLFLLLLLSVVALFIVSFWEWKRLGYDVAMRQHGPSNVLRANFSDVLLLVVGAACQQGSHVELKGNLGRTVLLVLFLMLMFLYTSYSANIVALLQSNSDQIQTLEDLLNSKIQCAVEDTPYNRYFFTTATDPIRKAFYERKIASGRNPKFISLEEGVKKIQQGSFAFHMLCGEGYKLVNKYFHESEKCKLKEIKYLPTTHTYISIAKKSPYNRFLKMGMRRIHEHGLQSRLYLLFYERQPRCARAGGTFVSVSMPACAPALLVLLYGLAAAVALCAAERALRRPTPARYVA